MWSVTSFMKSPRTYGQPNIRASQTSVHTQDSAITGRGKCQKENWKNIFKSQALKVKVRIHFGKYVFQPPCKCCSLDFDRDWTLSRNFPNLHSGLFIAHINILSILSGRWEDKYLTPKTLLCYAKRCCRYVRNEQKYTICFQVDQSKLQVMEEDKKLRRYSYFGRSSQQEKLEVQTLSFVKSFPQSWKHNEFSI